MKQTRTVVCGLTIVAPENHDPKFVKQARQRPDTEFTMKTTIPPVCRP